MDYITKCIYNNHQMMCFIELLKRVGHNYNSPVDPIVYARLRDLLISRHDWRRCRGGRKLPWRCGNVGNGSDEATYNGPEAVNQSDTVSIPAVVLEKLSACSGRLLLCGDININWMDKGNSCVKKLFNLLETYNLVQHITVPTHLLDYIISDVELVNSAGVSDFVSDHRALHASLVCTHSHPK